MSLHLGLHWNMMMGLAKKQLRAPSYLRTWSLRVVAAVITIYGAFALVHREIDSYMFLKNEAEIVELLDNVGYERVRLEGNTVQLDNGMTLDLGAVGKGYAGELVAQVSRENGITSALLVFGGNIQTIGTKPDDSLWRLGLRNPFSGGTLGILQISNMAVVTSCSDFLNNNSSIPSLSIYNSQYQKSISLRKTKTDKVDVHTRECFKT